MFLKIAVIADIHYRETASNTTRQGHLGAVLLRRAVERINRLVLPDVTVLLGDLLDCGDGPLARRQRCELADIAQKLVSPLIVLPGNHDGELSEFYLDFPKPPAWLDIGGYRLLPFADVGDVNFNAQRSDADLRLMQAARSGFSGKIVQLQHTSLFPSGAHDCPYNFTNIDEITSCMRRSAIDLSVSGHYHNGFGPLITDAGTFVGAPALCEEPFVFLEITWRNERVTVERHSLKMPPELGLIDCHVHTPLAYCSENMDFEKSSSLARCFGLAGLAFTEHSGHLYFPASDYWSGRCLRMPLPAHGASIDRMPGYLERARAVKPPAFVGIETDCGWDGRPLLRMRDGRKLDFMIGALHRLPGLDGENIDSERAADAFLKLLRVFLQSGIAVLAHPFRVFRRANQPVPQRLISPTVGLLKKYGVAAEINFHSNQPDPLFIGECLRAGVKVSFGSDAHNLYEVGDFALHLNLLKEIGFDGDLHDVLWKPRL